MVAQIATDHSPAEVMYHLPIGDELIALNPLLGKSIILQFQQAIFCCHCGKRPIKASVKVIAIHAFVNCHNVMCAL